MLVVLRAQHCVGDVTHDGGATLVVELSLGH
jgi:hypothetical protein